MTTDTLAIVVSGGILTLATLALTYVTLVSLKDRTIVEVVSLLVGRSSAIGHHSQRVVRERCADPHKHTGCNDD
jgi:hypothetical protein